MKQRSAAPTGGAKQGRGGRELRVTGTGCNGRPRRTAATGGGRAAAADGLDGRRTGGRGGRPRLAADGRGWGGGGRRAVGGKKKET